VFRRLLREHVSVVDVQLFSVPASAFFVATIIVIHQHQLILFLRICFPVCVIQLTVVVVAIVVAADVVVALIRRLS